VETAREFQAFADECLDWAKTAKSDREREIFLNNFRATPQMFSSRCPQSDYLFARAMCKERRRIDRSYSAAIRYL
jgi:hypothetical protein